MKSKDSATAKRIGEELQKMSSSGKNWGEPKDKRFYANMNNEEGILIKAYYFDWYYAGCSMTNFAVNKDTIYLELKMDRLFTFYPVDDDEDNLVALRIGIGNTVNEDITMIIDLPQEFYDNQSKSN